MHNRLIPYIAIAVIFFILGHCARSGQVDFIEAVKTDTVYTTITEPMRPVPLPIPEVRVVEVYDTIYTYKDTVRINERLAVPFFISSRGPVTDFRLGAEFDFQTITTERIRYIQPSGFYVGGQFSQFPGLSAAYLRNKWQFQYTYRPAMQAHEIGVLYRLSR
jgi:hypothetical protein